MPSNDTEPRLVGTTHGQRAQASCCCYSRTNSSAGPGTGCVRIHFVTTLIAAIEADTYDKHTSIPSFVAICGLCTRLVGIPEETISPPTKAGADSPDSIDIPELLPHRSRQQANDSRLKVVTWLVITSADRALHRLVVAKHGAALPGDDALAATRDERDDRTRKRMALPCGRRGRAAGVGRG